MCQKGGVTMNSKVIAKKLISLRGDKTREEVANGIEVSCSALAMYERGERIPKDEIKIRIANYYGKRVEEIFFA